MTNLIDLAAKVEAAEGPSFALDCEISKAVGSAAWPPRAYTASIDAAMMLVPDHCLMMVKHLWDGDKRCGYAFISAYTHDAEEADGKMWVTDYQGLAASPALALTAAALRARSEIPA